MKNVLAFLDKCSIFNLHIYFPEQFRSFFIRIFFEFLVFLTNFSEFLEFFRYPDLASTEFHRKKTYFNFISTAASMVFVPVLGLIADRFFIHSQMALLSPLVLQTAFIFYILISPLIPSILYSLGTSLNYTGMWANLSYCVDDRTMVLNFTNFQNFTNFIKNFTNFTMFFHIYNFKIFILRIWQ